MTGLDAKLADLANKQLALEGSLAELIFEVLQFGCAFEARRDSPNVVTLYRDRDGVKAEVQVIVKCGDAQEVRDDLWDAIINRYDMGENLNITHLANAAMERLGFPEPEGGWPK